MAFPICSQVSPSLSKRGRAFPSSGITQVERLGGTRALYQSKDTPTYAGPKSTQ